MTQIKFLLGLKMPSSLLYMHEKLVWLFLNVPSTNAYSVTIGLSSCVFLYGVKHWRQTYKPTPERMAKRWYRWLSILSNAASFVVLIFGGVVGYLTRRSSGDPPFPVIGAVPAGMKAPSFHFVSDFGLLLRMIPSGFAIALVSFTGNWAVARRYAVLNGYEVDANQEMMAGGLSNIFGTLLVNSFAVSGGLSRSAINAESGAVTLLSTFIAAVLIVFALFFFAHWFYYIPVSSLGAVVIISVLSMMDFQEMVNAYRTDKRDLVVIALTFLVTFFVGIVEGIAAGMFLSLAFVLKASAFPEIVTLGVLPGTAYFKDVARHPECEQIPGVAIVRMDATLYFANAAHFKEAVHDAALGLLHTSSEPVRYVVLDVGAWMDLDMAAMNTLSDIHAELLSFHVQLAFAHAKHNVHQYLLKMKFIEKIGGESHVFPSIADAVDARPARELAMQDELAAMTVARADVVRSASAASENVLFANGLRVLDDHIRAAVETKMGQAASATDAAAWSQRGSPVFSPLADVGGGGGGGESGGGEDGSGGDRYGDQLIAATNIRPGASFRFSPRAVAAAAAPTGSFRGVQRGLSMRLSGSSGMGKDAAMTGSFRGLQRGLSGSSETESPIPLVIPRSARAWRGKSLWQTDFVFAEVDVDAPAAAGGSSEASSPHFLRPKASVAMDVEHGDSRVLKES